MQQVFGLVEGTSRYLFLHLCREIQNLFKPLKIVMFLSVDIKILSK